MSRTASVRKARRVSRNESRRARSAFGSASDSDQSVSAHHVNIDLRSRTPSPMLGTSRGHLSAQGAFGPSSESFDAVLFGENDEDESRQEVESMLDELRQLNLNGSDGEKHRAGEIVSDLALRSL